MNCLDSISWASTYIDEMESGIYPALSSDLMSDISLKLSEPRRDKQRGSSLGAAALPHEPLELVGVPAG